MAAGSTGYGERPGTRAEQGHHDLHRRAGGRAGAGIPVQQPHELRRRAAEGSGFLGYLMSLSLMGKLLFGTFIIAVPAILIWSYIKGTRTEAQMMTAAMVLIVFNVFFWTLFEQAGSSLTLFRGPQHGPQCVRIVHAFGAANAELQSFLHRLLCADHEHAWTGLPSAALSHRSRSSSRLRWWASGQVFSSWCGVRRSRERATTAGRALVARRPLSDSLARRVVHLSGRTSA